MKRRKTRRRTMWKEWYPSGAATTLAQIITDERGFETRSIAAPRYPSEPLSRYKITVTVEEL